MIDVYLVIQLLILIALSLGLYLYFFRGKENKDLSKIKSEIEAEIGESFQKHLKFANESFLDLANENLEKHSKEAESNLKSNTQKVEKDVKNLKEEINSLGKNLTEAVEKVKTSGTNLSEHVEGLSNNLQAWNQAMASNKVRGDLGEEALERILSDSGLIEGKNYYLQQYQSIDGRSIKPDVVIELANGGNMVIDSKFPYDDFKRAVDENDTKKQEEHYLAHANAVMRHVKELSKKDYFSYLNSSPDYTILYLNNVIFYYHALRLIPDFVEQARNLNIVVATPEIIIPLLSGVMTQWKEHKMMSDVQNVTNEVSELHKRLKIFMNHFSGISKELGKAGIKVNQAIRSYNERVMPSIRRVEKLSGQKESIEELNNESLQNLNIESTDE